MSTLSQKKVTSTDVMRLLVSTTVANEGEQVVFMDNLLAHLDHFQMDIVATGPKKREGHHILSWSLPVPLSPCGTPSVHWSPGTHILHTNPCFTRVWLPFTQWALTAQHWATTHALRLAQNPQPRTEETHRGWSYGCSRPARWSLVHLKQ